MKSLISVVAAATTLAAVTLATSGIAAAAPADDAAPAAPAQSANERAGLPDLAAINRPVGPTTSHVEIDAPRTPSFHMVTPTGTEVTEFRDRNRPVEINVRSNLGTRYSMSAPADTSPQVPSNNQLTTRLPSVNLHY